MTTRRTKRPVASAAIPARSRQGAATGELAITLPLLVVLLLGTIDAGQFASAYQHISDASREGARFAARSTTLSSTQVDARVANYLATCFGTEGLANVTVNVRDANGVLTTGSLDTIASGSQIQVEVILPYAEVRIIPGIPQLTDQNLRATCVMLAAMKAAAAGKF